MFIVLFSEKNYLKKQNKKCNTFKRNFYLIPEYDMLSEDEVIVDPASLRMRTSFYKNPDNVINLPYSLIVRFARMYFASRQNRCFEVIYGFLFCSRCHGQYKI